MESYRKAEGRLKESYRKAEGKPLLRKSVSNNFLRKSVSNEKTIIKIVNMFRLTQKQYTRIHFLEKERFADPLRQPAGA